MSDQFLNSFVSIGNKVDEIPVEISYRILELFSGGLYQSPTKAIEELVANAFDAMASNVYIVISPNLDSSDATIVVIDDGESMDIDGLRILWKIGYSDKRSSQNTKGRLPIGKFGIGKLATWVLSRELTHICKRNTQYLAVTMFYEKINQGDATVNSQLKLDIRQLSEAEAQTSLEYIQIQNPNCGLIPLFGSEASQSWTVTILSNLKPMARDLKLGKLKWVLSTAMPLTTDFHCYLNGLEIEPSKMDLAPLNTWVIGCDDKTARNLKLQLFKDDSEPNKPKYSVLLSTLGPITGYASIYEDSLKRGKSEEWGRSHGFFIMVRGRLVNLYDPLFGNTALSHKTFNRFRMIVYCDGLDDFLLSSRESVVEKDATEELRTYLRSKFYEVASWYEDWLTKKEEEKRLAIRLGSVPRGLMRRPLVDLVLRAIEGKIPSPRLTRIPTGLSREEKKQFIQKTEKYLQSQEGFINDVTYESLGINHPIAIFDAQYNKVIVNTLHPFYRNYEDYFKNTEPFGIVGIAEVLTEAYLIDIGMNPDDVYDILARRDNFLRELVYSGRLSASLTADMLREAGGDVLGLERAIAAALQSLGFEVTPIGGSDEPDGIASARMGPRGFGEQLTAGYKITYDAKSTKHSRVQSGNVHIAGIDRHRRKYGADFALVVAKQFSDNKGEESAIVNEARRMRYITLIEAADLALLVETASVKRLGYQSLQEFFEVCCSPAESRNWIQKFLDERVRIPPIRDILYAIYKLQAEQREEIEFADIRAEGLKEFDKKEIGDWLRSVAALVPEYLNVRGDIVDLQMHPDKVLRAIGMNLRDRPPSYQRDVFLESLGEQPS